MTPDEYAQREGVTQAIIDEALNNSTNTRWENNDPVRFDALLRDELCETKEHKDGSITIRPVPGKIAAYLLERQHFKTFKDTERVYMYDARQDNRTYGLYVCGGEAWIKAATQIIIDEPLSTHAINEIIGHIQRRTFIDRETVDEIDIDLVPVGNGELNTKTRELRPFSPNMVYLTKWTARYNKEAITTFIDEYMRSTFAVDDIAAVQEFIGWMLERTMRFKKDLMLLAPGDNGKTVFENIITDVVGKENTASVSVQALSQDKFAAARLYQKYGNIYDDLPRVRIRDSGAFKILTGDGTAVCEEKFERSFTFRNYAKGIFSANELPPTGDMTPAFFIRWLITKMPYTFIDATNADGTPVIPRENERLKDYTLQARMTTPEMLSSWLNYMLDGLDRLRKNERFSTSKGAEEVKSLWVMLTDSFQVFIGKHIEKAPGAYIKKSELRIRYADWCDENDVAAMDDKKIAENLKKHIPTVTSYRPQEDGEGKRHTAWKGIKFSGREAQTESETPQKRLDEDEPQKTLDNDEKELNVHKDTLNEHETESATASCQACQGTNVLLSALQKQNVKNSIIIEATIDTRDISPSQPPIENDAITSSERDQLTRATRVAVFDIEKSAEFLMHSDLELRVRAAVASFIDTQKWQHPRETINAAVSMAWSDAQHDSDVRDAIANITTRSDA